MSSLTIFILVVCIIALLFLVVNLLLAPHNAYQEKSSAFECGFHSFQQSRLPFNISFFIYAFAFLIFDLEIFLVFPYAVSSYNNGGYGLAGLLIFLYIVTIGFIFELGKGALNIESKQNSGEGASLPPKTDFARSTGTITLMSATPSPSVGSVVGGSVIISTIAREFADDAEGIWEFALQNPELGILVGILSTTIAVGSILPILIWIGRDAYPALRRILDDPILPEPERTYRVIEIATEHVPDSNALLDLLANLSDLLEFLANHIHIPWSGTLANASALIGINHETLRSLIFSLRNIVDRLANLPALRDITNIVPNAEEIGNFSNILTEYLPQLLIYFESIINFG